jgi:hypothetical protein
MSVDGALLGVAGVHYVAFCLEARGYHAAPTIRNAPTVDLLVSAPDGSSQLALQVKTSQWALRTQGRGDSKKPHHYEWSFSWASIHGEKDTRRRNLFFALVDLREFPVESNLPHVFIVPCGVVYKYYEGGDRNTWKWPRYHETVEKLEPYKNRWDLVEKALNSKSGSP